MKIKIFLSTLIFLLHTVLVFPCKSFSQEGKAGESYLRIEDAVICQGVINREPIEPGDIFSNNVKKLFCFTRVVGAKEDTEIIHKWYYKGEIISQVILPVKSVNWRTYSSKTIHPEYIGEWKVEIVSKDREPLEQIYFAVN